jgi:basic membrane lipoprotein Med (substrate-binding protein (PBP1-ABC) superfamily)
VYKWEVALRQILDDLKQGVLGGKKYQIDLANGGLQIEMNEDYPLDDGVKKIAEDTSKGIVDGSIKVGM